MNIYKGGVSNSGIKKFYLFITFLVILFIAQGDQGDVISFYHFNGSKIIIYILTFTLIVSLIIIFNKNIYFDFISYLLFFRLGLYVIPILYIPTVENYWGNYFAVISSFLAYFITSQRNDRDITKSINKINTFFVIIICIQVFYAFFYLVQQYGNLNINLFKAYLIIPAGASNYIACIILPFLFFVYYSQVSKKLKLFIVIVSIMALLIIQSKNAMLVLILFITIQIIISYFKFITNNKDLKKNKLSVIVFTLIFIGFLVLISIFALKYFMDKWYMGMSISGFSIYELVNALTSNRLYVYESEIARWGNHLFLGNSLSYTLGDSKSHNWIIELLVQVGVIGFVVYLAALFIWIKKIKNYVKQDQFLKSCMFFVLIILVQGLAEVSLFTVIIDILFWSVLGLSVSHRNYIVDKPK